VAVRKRSSPKVGKLTSSEPVNGLGDGDTAHDVEITAALTVSLRTERSVKGGGKMEHCPECTLFHRALQKPPNQPDPSISGSGSPRRISSTTSLVMRSISAGDG
jgi:hypothetical protein